MLVMPGLHIQAGTSPYSHETPAYIDFQLSEWTVSENASEVEIVVIRTGEFREKFTLHYETVEETATQGRDYKGTGGTIIFQPMETFKSIKVGILQDDQEEGDESFFILLSSEEPKAFFVRQVAPVIIKEDRALPVLKVRPGESGTSKIVLSWSGSADCVLERASSLKGAQWEEVQAEVVMNGNECEIHQPISNPLFLYRLKGK